MPAPRHRSEWPVRLTAAVLVAVVLGPLAWSGYVLSYDMVFVPRQRLSWHLIAPVDALPRAVPLDAAVALANLVVPGALLQRLALAGLLYAAAVGAARVLPSTRLLPRLVAAVGYAWTPFLAERLLLGQWALLCCYAALPWLVIAAAEIRRGERRGLVRLVLAAAAASLTPTGGIIATALSAALLLGPGAGGWAVGRGPDGPASRDRPAGRDRPIWSVRTVWNGRTVWSVRTGATALSEWAGRPGPRRWLAVGAVVSMNAPWLVAAAVSSAGGRSDPAGVAAFAARAENWSGVPGALLGTGGVWNRLTTPDSRAWMVTPLLTLLVIGLAVLGWSRLRAGLPPGVAIRLASVAGAGFVLALAGATAPGAAVLRFLVVHVPGAGLLRDGQKFLLPYALLLILCAASGVDRILDRFAAMTGGVLAVGALLLPVLAMPDLAWGGAGALRPVAYPADYAAVDRIVATAPGEVLPLPFGEYRRFDWNHGRVVIDPLPRYLAAPLLADDTLVVGGVAIAGESVRAAQVRAHLDAGGAATDLGVAWVIVHRAGAPDEALVGLERVYSGSDLTLYRNPDAPAPATAPAGTRVAMALAYALPTGVLLATVLIPAGGVVVGAWRRRRTA